MDTLIGTQIANRYQIISLLGEGGMGGVYKALDHVLQMEVALKVLHERLAQQGDFRRRFLQEARTAARLNHPGIVRVFDFGRTESLLYIVMELIPGGNLHAFMQNLRAKQQWIDPAEAIQLVRQIALALDNAHRQSILHRDLKPANIMMRPAVTGDLPYQPVITDLGLAKLAEDGMTTNPGVTMGTPAYMSPEQAAGETLDPRSDVYSLGILLYELVVGQLPFPIKSLSQAVRYHIHEAPPPPRSLRPDLPAAVEAMLLKALSKRPEQRYASADEFASALAALAIAPATIRPLPASKRGVGSISTEYQNSLVSPVERLSTPSNLTPDGGETLLQIRLPDGSTRQMPVRKERITVGRVDGNDLVLQDHQISREHLRIDFSAAQVTVTDLGSTNGAHLDQVKLSPHQPAPWRAESVLRVGNHRLRYYLPKAAGSRERTTAAPPAARGRGATPVTSPQMEIASTVAGMPAARPPRTLNWLVILLAAIALATIGGLALLFAANPGIIPPLNPENVAVATAMATASATTLPSNGRGSPAGSPENNGVNPGGIVVAETATPTGTAIVTPTATPSATPTSTPTATSTPPPTASPTATHTALPPTDTPTAVPARPAETPTPTPRPPTSTPALPTHTPTPLPPTATATPLPRTDTPTPAPTPVRPGVLTDFENFGAWRRGDQAWGTFTQSGEQVREGRFAGKIDYNFPASAGTDSFVVFLQTLPTSGQPDHLSLWVYGNGSGHFLNSWIQDTAGQRWQFSFGQIKHIGWQQMQARLDPGQGWPNGKVMGDTGAKTITYPVQFLALVLDGVPDGVASSGAIYVDDLSAGASRSAAGGSVATATPLPRLLPAPTATSAPASGSYEALRSRLIGQMQRSSIRNDYSRQGTALVDALIGRLHDFQLPALGIGERTMVEALSREDAGDRLNAIVHAVMVDPGQSPFRQLIYRLIQGRQGVLTDSQQHALHSYFARAENPRVWQDNIAGVIGAVNRESFSWP